VDNALPVTSTYALYLFLTYLFKTTDICRYRTAPDIGLVFAVMPRVLVATAHAIIHIHRTKQ